MAEGSLAPTKPSSKRASDDGKPITDGVSRVEAEFLRRLLIDVETPSAPKRIVAEAAERRWKLDRHGPRSAVAGERAPPLSSADREPATSISCVRAFCAGRCWTASGVVVCRIFRLGGRFAVRRWLHGCGA
jgi:hypothetical protein